MRILGIDEAGRGPVLGSMFLAGTLIDKNKEQELAENGVTDSKQLSDQQRETLAAYIQEEAWISVHEITAQDIDTLRQFMSLNEIELQHCARIIKEAQLTSEDTVYIDLPEKGGEQFIARVREQLPAAFRSIPIVAEHKADERYSVVAAASIMGKSARESHVAALAEQFGQSVGNGYPGDEKTRSFIHSYVQQHGHVPAAVRTSWQTTQDILEQHLQKNLDQFFEQ